LREHRGGLVSSQNAVAVRRGLPPVRGLVRAMTNAGRPVLQAQLLPRAAVPGADDRGGRDGAKASLERSLQCYPKFYRMLSLTAMLSMPTFCRMKLTENTILVTGIGRGRPEAFHALGHKVIIAGRLQEVLDQTMDANFGMASVTLDERRSACVSF
jgi:hypothetical protein